MLKINNIYLDLATLWRRLRAFPLKQSNSTHVELEVVQFNSYTTWSSPIQLIYNLK
jgi:hypothetical protein